MNFKTDYKGIHEKAYLGLRSKGSASFSEDQDVEYRIRYFSGVLEKRFLERKVRVLMLGCGDGAVSIGLARLGYDVIGVDISSEAIRWAREKTREANAVARAKGADPLRAEFFEGSVLDLDFLSDPFQAVIDDHCFHCIIGDDRDVFLKQAVSCLDENGIFLVNTQCGNPPETESAEFMSMWDPVSRCQVYQGVAGRYFGLTDDIIAEVTDAGFEVQHAQLNAQAEGWHLLELIAIPRSDLRL